MAIEQLDLTDERLTKKNEIKKLVKDKLAGKDLSALTKTEKDDLLIALAKMHELVD